MNNQNELSESIYGQNGLYNDFEKALCQMQTTHAALMHAYTEGMMAQEAFPFTVTLGESLKTFVESLSRLEDLVTYGVQADLRSKGAYIKDIALAIEALRDHIPDESATGIIEDILETGHNNLYQLYTDLVDHLMDFHSQEESQRIAQTIVNSIEPVVDLPSTAAA